MEFDVISQEEENVFRSIMETLEEEASQVEEKIDNERRIKIALTLIALFVGVVVLFSGVMLGLLWLGVLGFAIMFAGMYFLSTVVHI